MVANNPESGASNADDEVFQVPNDSYEARMGRGIVPSCEVDPNSEEYKLLKAQRAERRAAVLKAIDEKMNGPDMAYQIDQALYDKAETRNAELTDEERALLQSRGDAVGKALAHPELLTTEETYEVMAWVPAEPENMYNEVRRRTNGAISDPLELYAKVKDAFEKGKLDDVSDGEISLVAYNFNSALNTIPGNREAYRLIAAQLSIDVYTLLGVASYIERERNNMAWTPGLCRDRHRHNWGLSKLPEDSTNNISSSQPKRKFSQDDADFQARAEELRRKNREGLAEIERNLAELKRSWESQGVQVPSVPWPAVRSATTPRTEPAKVSRGPPHPWRASRGYDEFRKERLEQLRNERSLELGSDEDRKNWNDPEVEAETDRLWLVMSKEEQDGWTKKSRARMMESFNKSRAEEVE